MSKQNVIAKLKSEDLEALRLYGGVASAAEALSLKVGKPNDSVSQT